MKHSSLHPKGHVWVGDFDGNVEEGETLMCVHCQAHWVIQPGSGIERGWCGNCNGPICGKEHCMKHCIHWEKKLDMSEKGVPVYDLLNLGAYIPTTVIVNVGASCSS